MTFTFIDLFAGIGGFHSALSKLGGEVVFASEIDSKAASVYELNWNFRPSGDITEHANDFQVLVPKHDVLVGGFPCQPFSKSGRQRGMEETRGTLFWNIAKILEERRPKIVILENVRNLAGPRHEHEWAVIIRTLRELGYRVSSIPLVISPHRIHPEMGGRPQIRERIFIAGTFVGVGSPHAFGEPTQLDLEEVMRGWDPSNWNLVRDLPLEKLTKNESKKVALTPLEIAWINAWDDLVSEFMRSKNIKLPSFPLWVDFWVTLRKLEIPMGTPEWKERIILKNATFYSENKALLDAWLGRWGKLEDFPPSRRKLEWQAGDAKSLWDCLIHFRPSGIRAKLPTYTPALVAITQTTIYGPQKRRLTVREAARLQALSEDFTFGAQSEAASYKQLGNGVNVSVVYHVMRALVNRDGPHLKKHRNIYQAISKAPLHPDSI